MTRGGFSVLELRGLRPRARPLSEIEELAAVFWGRDETRQQRERKEVDRGDRSGPLCALGGRV